MTLEVSKGVNILYSFTLFPAMPITNILAPSLENAMPVGRCSCSDIRKEPTKVALEVSKGVDILYSFTSLASQPTTNILVPSLENAMPCGEPSRADTEVAVTLMAVETSKGVDRSYSFTSTPRVPITNILAPSFENAMPVGRFSCNWTEMAETLTAVETSKGVDSSYSSTLSTILPTTNILPPSLENAMPCGPELCGKTEKESTKTAVEASKVPMIRFPDTSRTAPGSIVSSGAASPTAAARRVVFRLNEIVAPSATVPSSPAVRVTPCV